MLRGALNRGINVGLAVILLEPPCAMVYDAYVNDRSTVGGALLRTLLGYTLGVLLALPSFALNLKALRALCVVLQGKFFLSSQLALFDSRHGKNAVAYFYFLLFLFQAQGPYVRAGIVPGRWIPAIAAFPYGLYLGANVLPFVFAPTLQSKLAAEPESGGRTAEQEGTK